VIWTQVFNIHIGIQELKALRVIERYCVRTEESFDVKRSNKRRTELLAGKIQVNILCRKQNRITDDIRMCLGQTSISKTKVIGHTMQCITSLTHVVDNVETQIRRELSTRTLLCLGNIHRYKFVEIHIGIKKLPRYSR
jgi:hypothetical protein